MLGLALGALLAWSCPVAAPAAPFGQVPPAAPPAAWPATSSQTSSQSPPPATGLEAETRAVTAAYDQALSDFWNEIGAIPGEADQKAFFKRRFPKIDTWVDRVWKVIGRHLEDREAVPGLAWILEKADGTRDRAKAIDALLAHHLDHARLVEACRALAWRADKEDLPFLRRVSEESALPDCRVEALYVLGTRLAAESRWDEKDGAAKASEAEATLLRLREEFGDLPRGKRTWAGAVVGPLFELQHLAVGMEAPDIEGTDVHGQAFKLSDYRGQVVVLDFYGFW